MAFIHCAHGVFRIADRVALTHTGGEACPESVHAPVRRCVSVLRDRLKCLFDLAARVDKEPPVPPIDAIANDRICS